MSDEGLAEWVDFELWANRRCLASLAPLATGGEAARLFCHILAAQAVWLARLEGRDWTVVEVWPDPADTDMIDRMDELHRDLRAWAARADSTPCVYRTTEGVEYGTPQVEIIRHVLGHGPHHRGQIAAELRRTGREPAVVDYITYVRDG